MSSRDGEPSAKLAQLYHARDAALRVLEDLSERRSLVVLNGTEAELEDHHKQQFKAQRIHDNTVEKIKALLGYAARPTGSP